MPDTNPYAAPDVPIDDRTSLNFNGEIEERDYAELLPIKDFESKIYLGLMLILAAVASLSLVMITWGLITRGWENRLVSVFAVTFAIIAGAVIIYLYNRPLSRARRKLKLSPDLLGPASGVVNESGVRFHDGALLHWFSPESLRNAKVSRTGVRIQVDGNTYRFLAITSRLFDGFNSEVCRSLQRKWRESRKTGGATVDEGDEVGIRELGDIPTDSVSFRGFVKLEQSLRTPQIRRSLIIDFVIATTSLILGIAVTQIPFWIRVGLIAFGCFAAVTNGIQWKRYLRGVNVVSWNQSGWLSAAEMAFFQNGRGVRFSLDRIVSYREIGAMFVLSTQLNQNYFLARDHIASDDEWSRLKAYLEPKRQMA
ncbi:hypothetical protein [Stieleria varia]|uniref:YcxB-like protein domain-containing protein n=1 Tax=Stieleria varia TaxID=2528005 RepID=A0A5C6AQJ1_9BACT|nr:hypothetical protein [Stieleria varia]TWU01336.1 hypothetical protein Pla52n_47100 [Stieleria varia]